MVACGFLLKRVYHCQNAHILVLERGLRIVIVFCRLDIRLGLLVICQVILFDKTHKCLCFFVGVLRDKKHSPVVLVFKGFVKFLRLLNLFAVKVISVNVVRQFLFAFLDLFLRKFLSAVGLHKEVFKDSVALILHNGFLLAIYVFDICQVFLSVFYAFCIGEFRVAKILQKQGVFLRHHRLLNTDRPFALEDFIHSHFELPPGVHRVVHTAN